ncbi:pseudouridine synthase [Chelatococcus sambhunathii]|uniref:Pseudouridine synthase n=2 Tax=Chelatococcus sambhunathii TaxID=363953 RepID=A0ABM9U5M4_9HYPH|nr:pseudouridine synthase [Chelatococcus sambhunathii]
MLLLASLPALCYHRAMNDKSDDHRGPRRTGGKGPAGRGPAGKSFADRGAGGRAPRHPAREEGDRPLMRKARPGREERRDAAPRRPARAAAQREVLPDRDGRQRIAKIMARAGVASRRDAEEIIRAGRVAVNGKAIDTPATLIGPEDRVTIDGTPMPTRERTRLWLYHKPRGLVTTARDPEGRPTVFDALPQDLPRVVAIGRLDINTEGLLLLTNDGGLARVLAHPDTGWLRRYRVRAYGETDQAALDRLADGVTIEDMHYGPVEARLERQQGDNVWLTLGLREGKNREVKRILEHLGLRVNRLIRVSFGPFQLGDLGEGAVEEVRTRVLKDQLGDKLAAEAGTDFEAPVFAPDTDILERPGRSRRPAEARRASAAEPKEAARREETKGRSVWRADEGTSGRARPPRRGADPRAERQASAEKEHARAGRIADARGRKVLVERIVSPAEEPAREAPLPRRRVPAEGGRAGRSGADRAWTEDRPPRRPTGDRPAPRGRAGVAGRFDRSDERSDRPAGGKRSGKSFGTKSFGTKPFGGKPSGARPSGGKPAGGEPAGGRPGGKPGGRPPRPGGPRKPSGPRRG